MAQMLLTGANYEDMKVFSLTLFNHVDGFVLVFLKSQYRIEGVYVEVMKRCSLSFLRALRFPCRAKATYSVVFEMFEWPSNC